MKSRATFVFLFISTSAITACSPESLTGTVTVDGSATVYPLSNATAKAFHAINPDVQVDVRFSGTGGGFRKFCAGEIDVEGASRPIKTEEAEQCAAKHIEYIEIPVAFDSLSVVVSGRNTFVNCLTVQELKKIWQPAAQGLIKNWQQVRSNFPSEPLTLFGPGKDSGTFDYFTLAIVGVEASSRSDYTPSEDDMVIERGVESNSNALGYFGYAYYQANKGKVKAVAVDNGHGCVMPSAESVANKTYEPLSRPLLLYINVAAASRPEVKAFARLFLAPDSSQRITQVGYVPLPISAQIVQTARLEKGITGSALGGHGSVLGVKLDWFNVDEEEKVKAQLVQ